MSDLQMTIKISNLSTHVNQMHSYLIIVFMKTKGFRLLLMCISCAYHGHDYYIQNKVNKSYNFCPRQGEVIRIEH